MLEQEITLLGQQCVTDRKNSAQTQITLMSRKQDLLACSTEFVTRYRPCKSLRSYHQCQVQNYLFWWTFRKLSLSFLESQCIYQNLVLISLISTNMSFASSDSSEPGVTVTSNMSVCLFKTVTQSANQKIICLMYRISEWAGLSIMILQKPIRMHRLTCHVVTGFE